MPIHFRKISANEPLTFESIGNHWRQEKIRRPLGYPFFHLLLSEQGCGRITIQGEQYLLHENEGVLIAPHIGHSYASDERDGEWLTAFATFTGTIESSITQLVGGRSVVFISKTQGASIGALISELMKKYDNPPVDARFLSISCYTLLMYFVDSIYTHDISDDPLYQQYVAPIIKVIETKYDTELTVRELSRGIYVSPQYLSRLFHRFLGCSAYEYLTAYRISKAKEMLLSNPRLPIQIIAQRVGFTDASHFIAMFKKSEQITPLGFRKRGGSWFLA